MNKWRTIILVLCCIFCMMWMQACRKNKYEATPVSLTVPPGFPAPNLYANGGLTAEAMELGRRLFYDGRLSRDGIISCASCHQQIAAFGTYDHDLSHGLNGEHSNRNAPPLFNLAWYKSFGWDGRSARMEDIITAQITNPVQMGETPESIVNKLKATGNYPSLFKKAFGEEINSRNLINALVQFTASMVSASSKYDSVKQNLTVFTAAEQAGYTLFQGKCNSCHAEPLFTDGSYRNNGLAVNNVLNDLGRMSVTGSRNDSLKFRVPTLRNLYKSFPFMHDGRFIAFSQVFDHYQGQLQISATLDPLLSGGIPLSTAERNNLLAFLKTLTDEKFVKDGKYGFLQ